MHVTGSTVLYAADPMKIDGDARVSILFAGQPPWVIAVSGHGDLNVLNSTAHFTSPILAEFSGKVEDLTSAWHWSGNGNVRNLDLRTWGGGGALGQISGRLAVRGDADGFAGRGPLTPAGLGVGPIDMLFEGSYADRTITAKHFELTHGSGAHAAGSGTIAIADN